MMSQETAKQQIDPTLCFRFWFDFTSSGEATGKRLMEFMFQRNVSIAVLLTTVWPIKQAFDMEFVYGFGTDTASQWHTFQNDPFHKCDQVALASVLTERHVKSTRGRTAGHPYQPRRRHERRVERVGASPRSHLDSGQKRTHGFCKSS